MTALTWWDLGAVKDTNPDPGPEGALVKEELAVAKTVHLSWGSCGPHTRSAQDGPTGVNAHGYMGGEGGGGRAEWERPRVRSQEHWV